MAEARVVIEARNLVKKYGDRAVVDHVHLAIREGECFGILGPNGAGKSSAMRMMYCSSPLSAGDLFVLGMNVKMHQRKIKSHIGVVPQDDGLDPDFSTQDNLVLFAKYHNVPADIAKDRIAQLMHFMRLEDHADMPVDKLSGGLKRRLAIARALINDPKILFLDEPTTGLDPQMRLFIWDALGQMKAQGKSLVLTTHYMEEAEQMCDRVAIMDHGKILVEGSPKDLIQQMVGTEVLEFAVAPSDVQYFVGRFSGKYDYQILNSRLRLFIRENQDSREALNQVQSETLSMRKASLGDVFLKLSGHELRDER